MAKNKGLTINIDAAEIVGSEIMRHGEYKYARVSVKRSDSEYLSVNYEWKSEGIPDFVMGLMAWIQANKEEVEERKAELAEEYKSLKERS